MKQDKLLKKLMIEYYAQAIHVSKSHSEWTLEQAHNLWWRCSALVDVALYDNSINLEEFYSVQKFRDIVDNRFRKFRGLDEI